MEGRTLGTSLGTELGRIVGNGSKDIRKEVSLLSDEK